MPLYNIKPEIDNLLKTIPGVTVEQSWPEKKPSPSSFPHISFYELDNTDNSSTVDGGERESRIALQIDVWAKTGASRDSTAEAVDEKMKTMNFKREMAYDLADKIGAQVIKRKTMRYAVYIDLATMKLYRNPMR